jgi:hypothetical protein
VNPHSPPDRGPIRHSLPEDRRVPHFLPECEQIPHFLPEGGNDSSPGWSPPLRTQSWESIPNEPVSPVGAAQIVSLTKVGRISHFLPEGGNDNSPGWSPPLRTQSWESIPNKSVSPVGAARSNFISSAVVHAVAQIPCPALPARMNYHFNVDEFSSHYEDPQKNRTTRRRDQPGLCRLQGNFESTEGVVH